jgi:polyhydroxyalkanoate synthesis regulator phasin
MNIGAMFGMGGNSAVAAQEAKNQGDIFADLSKSYTQTLKQQAEGQKATAETKAVKKITDDLSGNIG